MRLGVLGGTFDPVHLGHLILAEEARGELGLERVLFVPAGQPWRKADRQITPAVQRVEMVRVAIADNDGFELSLLEVEREGPSYTVDTLEALRARHQGSELFFLMGLDALADLPNWRDPQGIIARAWLAVARRPGLEESAALAAVEERVPGLSRRVIWLAMPRIGISASGIRERVRRGKSIRYLVPAAVEAFIRERGLYRG